MLTLKASDNPQKAKKPEHKLRSDLVYGAPGGTRTPDPLIRSQVLYPAELLAQIYNQPFKAAQL